MSVDNSNQGVKVVNPDQKQVVGEEAPIASPCISVCALNHEDICTGCYRSADDIRLWGTMNNQERRASIEKAHGREKLVNPFL